MQCIIQNSGKTPIYGLFLECRNIANPLKTGQNFRNLWCRWLSCLSATFVYQIKMDIFNVNENQMGLIKVMSFACFLLSFQDN